MDHSQGFDLLLTRFGWFVRKFREIFKAASNQKLRETLKFNLLTQQQCEQSFFFNLFTVLRGNGKKKEKTLCLYLFLWSNFLLLFYCNFSRECRILNFLALLFSLALIFHFPISQKLLKSFHALFVIFQHASF